MPWTSYCIISPYYLDIYKELKKQDDSNNFSENFILENGIPIWEETLVFEGKTDFLLSVTPLINAEKDAVTGLIFASKINGIDYFNLVTKTGLYAELETVDETHPEIERLYNSLMFVNYYGPCQK